MLASAETTLKFEGYLLRQEESVSAPDSQERRQIPTDSSIRERAWPVQGDVQRFRASEAGESWTGPADSGRRPRPPLPCSEPTSQRLPMSARELARALRRRARHANLTLAADLLAGLERYYHAACEMERQDQPHGVQAGRLAETMRQSIACCSNRWWPRASCRLRRASLLDAGSGGGSPAIPLKLADPTLQPPNG